MTTLADLIAEVAAEHVRIQNIYGGKDNPWWQCAKDRQDWPCDAARLAAAFSVENVAAGLLRLYAERVIGFPNGGETEDAAAALLAAMTVAT